MVTKAEVHMPTTPMSNDDLVAAFKAGRSHADIVSLSGLPLPVIAKRRMLLERHGWLNSSDPPIGQEQRARLRQDLDSYHVPLVNASDRFFEFARAANLSHERMEQVRQHLLDVYRLVGVDPYAYLG